MGLEEVHRAPAADPIPAETVEGQYILRLSGTAVAQVLTCEGVDACEGGLFHWGDMDVTVSP